MNYSTETRQSALSCMDGLKAEMERLMRVGDIADHNKDKRTKSAIKNRPDLSDVQKRKMVKKVLSYVNEGASWNAAASEHGQGYEVSSVVAMAKRFGLHKPSHTAQKKKAARDRVDAMLPTIEKRRVGGMTVPQALRGTGVTEDQYHRARARGKIQPHHSTNRAEVMK